MVIEHNKHILLIGMHVFDALVLQEKLSFPTISLESKFILQIGQAWIHIIISIRLVLGH